MKHKIALLSLAFFVSSALNMAYAMQVTPTRIDLSAAKQKSFVTLINTNAEPLVIKTNVAQWTKQGKNENLTPTKDILVVPPTVTIAPGKKQVIRVALQKAPNSNLETAYRLFLEEVPAPPKAGFKGVQVALKLSLPVYVAPTAKAVHNPLSWSAKSADNQSIVLTCTNNNNTHETIHKLALKEAKGSDLASMELLDTVFPQQTGEWTVPVKGSAIPDSINLTVNTDNGSMNMTVPVQH